MDKPKAPTWEFRDLSDGRIGIFRDGICQTVVYQKDDAKTWFDKRRRSDTERYDPRSATKQGDPPMTFPNYTDNLDPKEKKYSDGVCVAVILGLSLILWAGIGYGLSLLLGAILS